jgi:hypothetical protein
MVEETTAAASLPADDADELAGLVGRFKTSASRESLDAETTALAAQTARGRSRASRSAARVTIGAQNRPVRWVPSKPALCLIQSPPSPLPGHWSKGGDLSLEGEGLCCRVDQPCGFLTAAEPTPDMTHGAEQSEPVEGRARKALIDSRRRDLNNRATASPLHGPRPPGKCRSRSPEAKREETVWGSLGSLQSLASNSSSRTAAQRTRGVRACRARMHRLTARSNSANVVADLIRNIGGIAR